MAELEDRPVRITFWLTAQPPGLPDWLNIEPTGGYLLRPLEDQDDWSAAGLLVEGGRVELQHEIEPPTGRTFEEDEADFVAGVASLERLIPMIPAFLLDRLTTDEGHPERRAAALRDLLAWFPGHPATTQAQEIAEREGMQVPKDPASS